ncbi:N-acetyltransferase [Arthrobacter sp. ISL-48]|uniref:N-acetyltransferase n=1 Tax=Arthrobacter sp. ISL-48 TaxID=2819110 RepID=UPI001BEA714E|nr:N-acetyltransferase [Arthrobacter sp. ISL-48]MBT2532954.1 N-acetyltransferase [Arthrobacter sp. ISL-48]
MNLTVVTLSERPDLIDEMWSLPNTWPVFMRQDPVANLCYRNLVDAFPEHQLVGLDEQSKVVGKVHSVPMMWDGSLENLPDRGWDAVLERAFASSFSASECQAVSLIEAFISPRYSGRGLSSTMLVAARKNAARMGYRDLLGPIRPTGKAAFPHEGMRDYVARLDVDGLPIDPWLRTHVRLGGVVMKVCPVAMTIPGTLAQWREWTGLELASSGVTEVPGALTLLHVSVEHDHCVYVEPNVWVRHKLAA